MLMQNTKSNNDSKSKPFTLQPPKLPTGGGAIGSADQNFQVAGMTGGIDMGIGGLVYNSGQGNGLFGVGFGAPNMASLSRRRHDGVPTYDDGVDEFTLAEAVLVPYTDTNGRIVKGGYFESIKNVPVGSQTFTFQQAVVTASVDDPRATHRVSYYRPRREGAFYKLEHWVQIDDNSGGALQDFWRLIDSGNSVHLFGVDTEARIRNPADVTRIFTWLPQETWSPLGQTGIIEFIRENAPGVSDAQVYAGRSCGGHQYPIPQPLSYLDSATRAQVEAATPWYFETLYDYGQYSLPPATQTPYTPTGTWDIRPDAHSTYYAGFEIRTLRLCRRMMSFHRFEEQLGQTPLLTAASQYHYDENPQMTLLKASEHIGFYYNFDTTQYEYMASVPDEIDHTGFSPLAQAWGTITRSDGGVLMVGDGFMPVDLHNEGIDGFLFADGRTRLFYRIDWPSLEQDQGVLTYTQQDAGGLIPWHALATDAAHQLIDINGDGYLDYVVFRPGKSGYYEYDPALDAWSGFTPFPALPTETLLPQHYMVDVIGDGRPDVVVLMNEEVRYYRNEKDQGFAPGVTLAVAQDDLPASLLNTPDILFGFASMCGDGLSHMVRVTRNSVSYWPNLGHGRFGARVEMTIAGSTEFDLGSWFRSDRVHFADLNGDGAADLILTAPDGIDIYMNQSGNSFAEQITLDWPEGAAYDDLGKVLFADVKGNGTQCLVYCQTHPAVKMWYYDFCDGVKPYMVREKTNNLGSTITITHTSSVNFYLEDDYNGNPWLTRAPFPVQVVSQTVSQDSISNTTLTTLYRYRNSYWDGIEQEFRGFGYSQHQDTMQFDQDDPDFSMDSPPALSKAWYHVGAINQNTLTKEFAVEYYQGDLQAAQLEDSKVYNFVGVTDPNDFSPKNRIIPEWDNPDWVGSANWELYREAQMALKGSVLRSEVYGLDGSDRQDIPYTTSEINATVKILQDKGANDYAIVQVLPREELNYAYDRNPRDPHYSHGASLSFDAYGHVLSSCGLVYPRRASNKTANNVYYQEQFVLRLSFSAQQLESFENAAAAAGFAKSTDEVYLLGIPVEAQAYVMAPENGEVSLERVLDYRPGTDDTLVSSDLLQKKLTVSYQSGYGFTFADNEIATLAELAQWGRQYYMYPDQTRPLSQDVAYDGHYDPVKNTADAPITAFDLGRVSSWGLILPWYTEAVAFDKASISANFDQLFAQMAVVWQTQSTAEAMLDHGHYIEKAENEYWWVLSGHLIHQPGEKYFMPVRAYDILGNYNQVTYDDYLLFATSFTDAVGNTTRVNQIDYQYLQPTVIQDPNENLGQVLMDARGAVISASYYGSETRFLKDPIQPTLQPPNYGWQISDQRDTAQYKLIVYTPDNSGHYTFGIYGPAGSDTASIVYGVDGYYLLVNGEEQTLTATQQQVMVQVDQWMNHVQANQDDLIANLTSIGGFTPSDLVAYPHELNGFDTLDNFTTYIYDEQGMESVPDLDDFIHNMRKYVQNTPSYFYYDIYAWIGRITKKQLALHTGLADVSGLWDQLIQSAYIGYTGAVFSATRLITSADELDLGEYQQYAPQVLATFQANPGGSPVNVATATAEYYPRIFPEDLQYITDDRGHQISPDDWESLWQALVDYKHIDGNGLVYMATWDLTSPGQLTLPPEQMPYQASTFNYIQSIAVILFGLAYNDGFGRVIQAKQKIEQGQDCLIYNPAAADDRKVIANPTKKQIDWRWLTSGHKVYNNKGQVVKAYEPYFIATPECVDYHWFDISSDQTVQNLAVSSVSYYDPLGRAPYAFTTKGFLARTAETPWQQMGLEMNDALVDSPYFLQNVISPDTNGEYYDDQLTDSDRSILADPAKFEDGQEISSQGLAYLKTLHHGWTPSVVIRDNRGLPLAGVTTDNRQFTSADFEAVTQSEEQAKELYADLVDKGYLTRHGYLGLALTMPPLSLFNSQSGSNGGIAFHNDALLVGFNRLILNCLLTAAIGGQRVTQAQIEGAVSSNAYTFYSLVPFAENVSAQTVCQLLVTNGYLRDFDKLTQAYQVDTKNLPIPKLDLAGTPFSDQTDEILKQIIFLWSTGMQELVTVSLYDNQGRATSMTDPRFVDANLTYFENLLLSP